MNRPANRVRRRLSVTANGLLIATAVAITPSLTAADETVLEQHYTGDDPLLTITDQIEMPDVLIQHSGSWKRDKVASDLAYTVGLHVRSNGPITIPTRLQLADNNTSHVLGVHGNDTVARFTGHWQGDGSNSYPNLVVTKGARFIITPEAEIDLVMAESFYTRQLWTYGDGTGTVEIEAGHLADRTADGTLPNGFGTIRLNGVHLITHHSDNLPFNTRPEGRGAVYPNGHIVWEGQPNSVWTVATTAQRYPAQLDFHIDGTIHCDAHLVHHGQKRVTAHAMIGGRFMSTGAFRTCAPDVTITKSGPGMLALEGQQGYYPNSTLRITDGVLRMTTNPGNGHRYDDQAGPHLTIEASQASHVVMAGETMELAAITLTDQTHLSSFADTTIIASAGINLGPDTVFHAAGTYHGDCQIAGTWRAHPGTSVTFHGALSIAGALHIGDNRRWFKRERPTTFTLLNATSLDGSFSNYPDGAAVTLWGGRAEGTLRYRPDGVDITNITYQR